MPKGSVKSVSSVMVYTFIFCPVVHTFPVHPVMPISGHGVYSCCSFLRVHLVPVMPISGPGGDSCEYPGCACSGHGVKYSCFFPVIRYQMTMKVRDRQEAEPVKLNRAK